LELANGHRPNWILLDLGLPGRSGVQVLEEIKRSAPTREIPVLIMSGYALVLADDVVRQADGAVAKPFDFHELLRRVDQLISQ
jgi:CheY-like chemotaxis protein